ncbi:MAG TPA: GNAT family N-acyltransferase [Albitalea sp.]|jgi:putative hemolysin|nr:GNAT family N-acyltransferase [Albitalea sp.]
MAGLQHARMNDLNPELSRVAGGEASVARRRDRGAEDGALRLVAQWARHTDDVRAAQQLRWRVFVDEMGASLTPAHGVPDGHDADRFDDHCEHLLVRTLEDDGQASRVVGTYRVLTPAAARRLGGLYTDLEFDLTRLHGLRPRMAELGRTCTDAQWRNGAVIMLLWSELARFMQRNQLDVMIGCASVAMRDGGHAAASLWERLRVTHMAPEAHRVTPRLALPVNELRSDLDVDAPPLIKGYLKCGAQVLGPPAWDPDFGTADLPMMLALADVPPAYRRRFLGPDSA